MKHNGRHLGAFGRNPRHTPSPVSTLPSPAPTLGSADPIKPKHWFEISVGLFWILAVLVMVYVVLALGGCSGLALLNQNNTEGQTRAILEQQNARGCVFFRGSAAPWASVQTVVVGTWGNEPPPYHECWKGLPQMFNETPLVGASFADAGGGE